MRAWLDGAPLWDGLDPAVSELLSVLTVGEAVGDLGGAIRRIAMSHPCPARPAGGVPRGRRSDLDFVDLRFVAYEPQLPKRHTDVLLRERSCDPAPGSAAQLTFYSGSIFRSGDDVVVQWRMLDHWPPGWRWHPAPSRP